MNLTVLWGMRKYTETNIVNNRNNSLFGIEWRTKFIWTQTNVMGTRKEGEIHGNRIYSSAVYFSGPSIKSQDTLYHVLWIGSAEICPNLSEMHIAHSFRGVQLLKNPWSPYSYSYCFSLWPINSIFPVKPFPSSLSFWGERNGGARSKVTPNFLDSVTSVLLAFLNSLSLSFKLNNPLFFSSPTF